MSTTDTSTSQRALIRSIIDESLRPQETFQGPWSSDWLISNIEDNIWMVKSRNSYQHDGQWFNTEKVDWRRPLGDGSKLTDSDHREMLAVCQKLSFLWRHFGIAGCSTTDRHITLTKHLLTVVEWLYLNKDIYSPDKHFFGLFSAEDVESFLRTYRDQGKFGILHVGERVTASLVRLALEREPTQAELSECYNLPSDTILQIVRWLSREGYYSTHESRRSHSFPCVRRKRLMHDLHIPVNLIGSPKATAYFRQFEVPPDSVDRSLLIPRGGTKTEHPGQWVPLRREVIDRRATYAMVANYHALFKLLLYSHRHLPHAVPTPQNIDLAEIIRPLYKGVERGRHTPWMPLELALTYFGEAIRIFEDYGKSALVFYNEARQHFLTADLFNTPSDCPTIRERKRRARDSYVDEAAPSILKEAGVRFWTTSFLHSNASAYSDLRKLQSISDLIQLLVGASILLVAMVKPLRENEIRSLTADCVTHDTRDGYWLHHRQSKRKSAGPEHRISRPIPAISARAIDFLKCLSDFTRTLVSPKTRNDECSLFYLPRFQISGSLTGRTMDVEAFKDCLDLFSDFLNAPTDRLGRRWYVRIHEMRKSFLISFFWMYKHSSLDAARWIAGHSDPEHIYAYISANFPGDELPELEADYAAAQMWDFLRETVEPRSEGIESIYRSVCEHFSVSSVDVIDSTSLMDWLKIAFRTGQYKIDAIRLFDEKGEPSIRIAFRVEGERANEPK